MKNNFRPDRKSYDSYYLEDECVKKYRSFYLAYVRSSIHNYEDYYLNDITNFFPVKIESLEDSLSAILWSLGSLKNEIKHSPTHYYTGEVFSTTSKLTDIYRKYINTYFHNFNYNVFMGHVGDFFNELIYIYGESTDNDLAFKNKKGMREIIEMDKVAYFDMFGTIEYNLFQTLEVYEYLSRKDVEEINNFNFHTELYNKLSEINKNFSPDSIRDSAHKYAFSQIPKESAYEYSNSIKRKREHIEVYEVDELNAVKSKMRELVNSVSLDDSYVFGQLQSQISTNYDDLGALNIVLRDLVPDLEEACSKLEELVNNDSFSYESYIQKSKELYLLNGEFDVSVSNSFIFNEGVVKAREDGNYINSLLSLFDSSIFDKEYIDKATEIAKIDMLFDIGAIKTTVPRQDITSENINLYINNDIKNDVINYLEVDPYSARDVMYSLSYLVDHYDGVKDLHTISDETELWRNIVKVYGLTLYMGRDKEDLEGGMYDEVFQDRLKRPRGGGKVRIKETEIGFDISINNEWGRIKEEIFVTHAKNTLAASMAWKTTTILERDMLIEELARLTNERDDFVINKIKEIGTNITTNSIAKKFEIPLGQALLVYDLYTEYQELEDRIENTGKTISNYEYEIRIQDGLVKKAEEAEAFEYDVLFIGENNGDKSQVTQGIKVYSDKTYEIVEAIRHFEVVSDGEGTEGYQESLDFLYDTAINNGNDSIYIGAIKEIVTKHKDELDKLATMSDQEVVEEISSIYDDYKKMLERIEAIMDIID